MYIIPFSISIWCALWHDAMVRRYATDVYERVSPYQAFTTPSSSSVPSKCLHFGRHIEPGGGLAGRWLKRREVEVAEEQEKTDAMSLCIIDIQRMYGCLLRQF